jgi:hypothetical protein
MMCGTFPVWEKASDHGEHRAHREELLNAEGAEGGAKDAEKSV